MSSSIGDQIEAGGAEQTPMKFKTAPMLGDLEYAVDLARKMLGLNTILEVPQPLVERIRVVHTLSQKGDGLGIRSSQIVALMIAQWQGRF